MTIEAELQSLSPTALVELFVLDMSNLQSGGITYFHAGTNELQQPVIWQGNTYLPIPIEATGFDISSRGTLPRPKVKIANINGMLSAQVSMNDDLIGCKLIRKRTYVKYLDAVNFSSGVNVTADPNQHMQDDSWFIDRKVTENKYLIEWELASAFDLQGVMLPYRQIVQNTCPWKYRGAECGWTGASYDANNIACTSDKDSCSKHLSSCRIRFGAGASLPYGGFPGAVRYG